MLTVDFFFDCSCPWTYLGFTRLRETATRTGATIKWHPIFVDRVRRLVTPDCPESRSDPVDAREKYRRKDLQDWARYCAVTIRVPADWPADTQAAMCGAVIAERQGVAAAYVGGVFRAYFGEGRNIDDRDVLADIAGPAGVARETFLEGLDDPEILDAVYRNCDALIARGGFGSPSFFVGDDMYFGNDRIPLLEFALGQASGRKFVMPGQHGV